MVNEYKKVIKDKKAEAKRLMTDDQVVKCNVAIHTASVATATEAFIPIPGVDAIPITATQVTMVLALGKIFDQKVSDSAAKGIIGAAASTFVGRSLVKLIPIAGWTVSAAVAAGVTEAIGWFIAVDFAKQTTKRFETVDKPEESHVVNDDVTCDTEYTERTDNSTSDVSVLSTRQEETNVNGEMDDNESNTTQFQEQKGEELKNENDDVEDNQDDESISNDFSKALGEDE